MPRSGADPTEVGYGTLPVMRNIAPVAEVNNAVKNTAAQLQQTDARSYAAQIACRNTVVSCAPRKTVRMV
jgi:hypothetical protein